MADLIEVRPEERFDRDRLGAWLDTVAGLPSGVPTVEQFSGGKANLTYLLKFPDGTELVLRRPPLGPVAPGAHDMAREFQVLSQLWTEFDLAPRALALGTDLSVIGSTFLLMERKDGVVVRGVIPERFGGGADPEANRKLSTVVIDTLAQLHRVEPEKCGLDTLGNPEGYLERQVEGWSSRWARASHQPNDDAARVEDWLRANLPPTQAPTLVHNDWRLDNMAVDPDDPGRCVAVYDWDMATRGDPLTDLGTLMATWFEPGEAPKELHMMPTESVGWLSRDEAIDRYLAASGVNTDRVSWYLAFGSWKMGIILQQIYARWLNGQTQDERFANFDSATRLLMNLASKRIGQPV